MGVSCQSSFYLYGVKGTQWECLVNRLFTSMKSWVLIVSVLSIMYLSPTVMGTQFECLVNRLFVSMKSMLLIWSELSIVYFSPWCHRSIL